jgi:hypothetical protein
MALYFEIYAFQGSNWTLIEAFEGERTQLEPMVSDVYIRHRVLGVRVTSEEVARNGEKRMRIIIRRDKRDGLPPFVLSAEGKPLYAGKPLPPPMWDKPPADRRALAAAAPGRGKEPSVLDLGDWFKAGVIVVGAAVSILVIDRVRNVPAEYQGLLDVIRLLLLAAIVLAVARPLIRTWRSGALHIAMAAPRRRPAADTAATADKTAAVATEDPDVLVRQGIGLVDEGFRRVRDGLDAFGWLGFRLFLAGMAKAMAPAGPEERQRDFLRILLERIGDSPEAIETFVARGYAMYENDRNARMAEAGATAWDGNDPGAFERAIAWWNNPAAADMAPAAPPPTTALVCLIARNVAADRKGDLQRRIGQLASANGASDRGDATAHTLLFKRPQTGISVASELLRLAGDGAMRLGIATDPDAVEASIRARSLADGSLPDRATADAATQVAVPDPALWEATGTDGTVSLRPVAAADQSAA